MTVSITREKPNNFPAVEIVDVQKSDRGTTLILGTRIEGELVRVSANLSDELASALASRLEQIRKK